MLACCFFLKWTLTRAHWCATNQGWDVRRVGTNGWVAHPVDVERFNALARKHAVIATCVRGANPVGRAGTIERCCRGRTSCSARCARRFAAAATKRRASNDGVQFEGREQALWDNFQSKYVVGPKPNEPTWGKNVRKARWASYYEELERWEAFKRECDAIYADECAAWNLRRQQYNEEHAQQVTANAGVMLLKRALSGGQPIILTAAPQPAPLPMAMYMATVPEGKRPGDAFLASVNGQAISVTVPVGSGPGSSVQFSAPAPVQQPAAPVVQASVPPAIAKVRARTTQGGGLTITRASLWPRRRRRCHRPLPPCAPPPLLDRPDSDTLPRACLQAPPKAAVVRLPCRRAHANAVSRPPRRQPSTSRRCRPRPQCRPQCRRRCARRRATATSTRGLLPWTATTTTRQELTPTAAQPAVAVQHSLVMG